MNPKLSAWLQTQGAVIENGQVRHFGDPMAERQAAAGETVLIELSGLSCIRVRGAEALSFLNGQLSNDVRHVDRSQTQLAAWCNPKGRVLALLRVLRRDDEYCLLLPRALRETVLARLRMFILRAKVTLDNDDGLVPFGLAGPLAEALLRECVGEPPATIGACTHCDNVTVTRVSNEPARFLVVAPMDAVTGLWERLRPRARPVGFDRWRWLDIVAGIPQVYPETAEAFVPQMLNLELVGGVDFKKGCYPGQEIVARLHYRGGLKQRMYRLQSEADTQPGVPVYAPDLPGDQATGAVVDAVAAPDGGTDLLAVVHVTSAARGELHLAATSGPRAKLSILPYAMSVPENARDGSS
jgi:folate-binding protein YgfZ